MQRIGQKIKCCVNVMSLITAPLLGQPIFGGASGFNSMEIRSYRYAKHSEEGFERLVLEFSKMGSVNGLPVVAPVVAIDTKNSETRITVKNASWNGAVPEGHINRSFANRSQTLGNIKISTQNRSFSLSSYLKSAAKVDAFWLRNPERLVVDVFPNDEVAHESIPPLAPIENGQKDSRIQEVQKTSVKTGTTNTLEKTETSEKTEMPLASHEQWVLCFPTAHQRRVKVTYGVIDPKDLSGRGQASINGQDSGTDKSFVCFPLGSRMAPKVALKLTPFSSPEMATVSNSLVLIPDGFAGADAFSNSYGEGVLNSNPVMATPQELNVVSTGLPNLANNLANMANVANTASSTTEEVRLPTSVVPPVTQLTPVTATPASVTSGITAGTVKSPLTSQPNPVAIESLKGPALVVSNSAHAAPETPKTSTAFVPPLAPPLMSSVVSPVLEAAKSSSAAQVSPAKLKGPEPVKGGRAVLALPLLPLTAEAPIAAAKKSPVQ